MLLLNIQRAGEGDVAVEMSFVKLVEHDGGNPLERRVSDELAEQNAFGLEFDFGGGADAIFKAHLIANLTPQLHIEFLRDTGSEHSSGEPARLEHDALPAAEQAVFEKHLRDLRGFAGPCGYLQHETFRRLERGDDVVFDVVNGQPVGHAADCLAEQGRDGELEI